MKTRYLHIIWGFFLVLITSACTDDWEMPENSKLSGKEAFVTLDFGFSDFEEVKITTRSTLNEVAESRVHNLFVYIFTTDGKKIFGKYYDKSNKVSQNDFRSQDNQDCWWVSNKLDDSSKTHGQIGMLAPIVTTANLYIIANIDADMVNISPEKMNAIQTEQDVRNLTAKLNQQTTSRNGYFPMSYHVEGIEISQADKVVLPKEEKVLLERLDAKVQFYFKVNKDKETQKDDTTKQTVKAFVPESWRIVNIPKGTFVFQQNTENENIGYFNSDLWKFETTEKKTEGEKETEIHGFSYYMLENRKVAKKSVGTGPGNYHLRDKRNKDAYGKYDNTNGLWKYAPEEGTYIEVKGRILMDVNVTTEAPKQQLEADVKYYIHLGNFKQSMDDYDVERNTFYTYNVTINGVNSIEVEVTTSKGSAEEVEENQAGATGMVYVAKEEIYTFDAHYGQRVFCFDAAFIEPSTVTWYVKTPFGKEGVPEKVGDTEVPSGMDYKWVHFYLNKHQTTDSNSPYSKNNQPYPGDNKPGLMNVVEFTKYIKDQKRKFEKGEPNDFRKEFDQEWFDWAKKTDPSIKKKDDGKWWRYRIYMTVFVDEFYYEEDPITHEASDDLWKKFVNQPNRLMHVLCDSEKSLDGESTATGSVVTLRQRSIQTPYNIENASLKTAWGCESVDETADKYLWFYEGEKNFTAPNISSSAGNTSKFNGAYNTAHLWGLSSINGNSFKEDVYWIDKDGHKGYLNYDVENDQQTLFLKSEYASMRYAAMMRNRDNNGNGKIDPDEVRWYIASIDQLYGLYIGQQGINEEAALYTVQRSNESGNFEKGPFKNAACWRYHVVSSTKHPDSKLPIELWAEEGVSTSAYKQYSTGSGSKPAPYAIRCVRNLGINPTNQFNTNNEEEGISIPQKLIQVEKTGGTNTSDFVYKFDLSNINNKSLRFYTSHELEPENEFSEMSMPYVGFETGPLYECDTYQAKGTGIRALLLKGESPVKKTGYRVPNVREGALMSLYCENEAWWESKHVCVSSFYSNGEFGGQRDRPKDDKGNITNYYYSWQFGLRFASIGDQSVKYVRSVRDWRPTP